MTSENQQQAVEYYQRVIRKMPPFTPFRINAHIRLGKLYVESGDTAKAIQEFSAAANQYTHNGALVKAIAVNTMIKELDPSLQTLETDLSTLYFKQTGVSLKLDESFRQEPSDSSRDQDLARVSLFSYLAEEERQKIAEFLAPVEVEKGAIIIQEGEIGDCMYLIKSGEVEVYTRLLDEEQQEAGPEQERLYLATLKANDFFGEQALMTHEPRNATILAVTDVELLRFSRPDLEAVVRSYPRVGELLDKYHHQRNNATINSLKSAFR